MTNKDIARVLKETASLIQLTGGNAFRARAFDRAARQIERLYDPVGELLAEGTLTDVPGIGAGLAAEIRTLLDEGTLPVRDELLSALPPGLLDALRIKGLGAAKVRTIWRDLGITTLDELEAAAEAGHLAALDGFGPKTQANVLKNLRQFRLYQQRRRYAGARTLAEPLRQRLAALDALRHVALTGELRRRLETVGSAEFVAGADDLEAAAGALTGVLGEGTWRRRRDGTRVFSGELPDGLPMLLHLVPAPGFGTALFETTGAEDFVAAFEARHGAPAEHEAEADVFAAAGLAFVEPELREDAAALEAAADGRLPDLITAEDLRGVLHNHSTYSDGKHSLREMAETTRAMGFEYFGICDHSQSLKIAGGLTVDEVRRQQDEIRRLNEEFSGDGGPRFRLFSGIECDILADGALDYDDDVLASFDFVVASVHTRFGMSEAEATERVVRAVSNPFTTILGHPTGRLLLAREGYPLDHEAVIDACAAHGVAIELNANPYRLDLDWRWIRTATVRGVLIAINPDAHSTEQLDYMRWGVEVARKGWLTAADCLNARSLDDFEAWLGARRGRAAQG